MPKPVKIRVHFTEDAKFLMRLKSAIERDSRPSEWSQEVSALIDRLAVLLIQAPGKVDRALERIRKSKESKAS